MIEVEIRHGNTDPERAIVKDLAEHLCRHGAGLWTRRILKLEPFRVADITELENDETPADRGSVRPGRAS